MAKKIEDNFKELDEIVEKMQSEEVSLDESFELYQKGLKLVKDSNEQIDTIEKKIKTLDEESSDE
ncbi:MAG: exodeoxyribonuclease VII small subunit [Eubacterium sp.]|nr:exodeoxyribonuclease VII small subunit [Eubacterium sp.]